MTGFLGRFFLVAYTSISFFGFARAQTNDTSSLPRCPALVQSSINGDYITNSIGTMPFQFPGQNTWHLSLTLRDRRAEYFHFGDYLASQDMGIFVSVPTSLVGSERGRNTKLCTYWMPEGLNATSEAEDSEDAEQSCKGVLSKECLESIQTVSSSYNDKCPAVDLKACGKGFNLWTSAPTSFSSPNCSLDDIPGASLPDKHRTFYLTGASPGGSDRERDSFEVYDLRVMQSYPILLTMPLEGQRGFTAAQVICLSPNNTVKGSRIPKGDVSWNDSESKDDRDGEKDAASGTNAAAALVLAVVMSLIGASGWYSHL